MIYDVIDAIDEELKITRCKSVETSCFSTTKNTKCCNSQLVEQFN